MADLITESAAERLIGGPCTAWIHWTQGMIHVQGEREWGGMRLQHAFQNGLQFKTCESFISGIFHLVFLDHSWPLVTETADGVCICVWGATVIKNV